MENEKSYNSIDLRHLILNSNEPFVIPHKLNWCLMHWRLEYWSKLLKNEKLIFRCGEKSFTTKPQWERTTKTKTCTFDEFLKFTETETDNWMYFDYKYLKEWFRNIQELKNAISWSEFGFPEFSFEDSTIWIGSSGAHTPCHIDTYGCNLIAQIYGKKQWILCPFEEDLKATRIPYEESSIYSDLNFYSPTIDDFKGIKNCRKVILEPGDVLFVPHKWWHYVENLETAISINVWIPLATDCEERFKESIIQFFVSQITKNLSSELKESILNPNSEKEIENLKLDDSLHLINVCKKMATSKTEPNLENISSIKKFVTEIPILSEQELSEFLKVQRNRFKNEEKRVIDNSNDLINVINAFTHSDVISLIKNKLL